MELSRFITVHAEGDGESFANRSDCHSICKICHNRACCWWYCPFLALPSWGEECKRAVFQVSASNNDNIKKMSSSLRDQFLAQFLVVKRPRCSMELGKESRSSTDEDQKNAWFREQANVFNRQDVQWVRSLWQKRRPSCVFTMNNLIRCDMSNFATE